MSLKYMQGKYDFPPKKIKLCLGCGGRYSANVGQKYHDEACKLQHYRANGLGRYRKTRKTT